MTKIGLFTPSTDSAALPGRGPVPAGTKPFEPEDFDGGTLQPAKTWQQAQAQLGQLAIVFQDAEGREPAPGDAEFWQAYNAVIERWQKTYEKQGPAGPHD